MKAYTIKQCLFCNSEIPKRINQSIKAYSNKKFCKLTCQHKWNHKTKSLTFPCKWCKKQITRKRSQVTKAKNSFCSLECFRSHKSNVHNTTVVCKWCGKGFTKKMSQISKSGKNFCSQTCMGNWQSKYVVGESAYNYKDGRSSINLRIRSSVKFIKWRNAIYKRDTFTCQVCGDSRGGNLNAHHIKQLSDIISDNNIKELIQAFRCKEIWDISNGITLCKTCHNKQKHHC